MAIFVKGSKDSPQINFEIESLPAIKKYAPWESPHYSRMNRKVDRAFGKKPNDPDQSHWIFILIIALIIGFIKAALKSH